MLPHTTTPTRNAMSAWRTGGRLLVLLMLVGLQGSLWAQPRTTWQLDAPTTEMGFSIGNLMFSTTQGLFEDFSGTVRTTGDDFADAQITVQVLAKSVNTDQQKRDDHLRGPDFFSSETHPHLHFESTSMTRNRDATQPDAYTLKGLLTMNGITRPITLEATRTRRYSHPTHKRPAVVFHLTGELKRKDYAIGSSYPSAAIAQTVKLDIRATLVQTAE